MGLDGLDDVKQLDFDGIGSFRLRPDPGPARPLGSVHRIKFGLKDFLDAGFKAICVGVIA